MTHEEMLEEAERREKAVETAKEGIEEYSEVLEELAESEKKEFYRFLVVEYFGTGEGISYFLQISRNYGMYDDKDRVMERFKKFIDEPFYNSGIEELKEEEFMTRFAALIPTHVVKMVERKDQPSLEWQTYFHVNYS